MDANEFAKSAQTLGKRYVEEYTRGLQRYSELLNNMAKPDSNGAAGRGVVSAAEQQNRYSEFVINEAPKVLQQLSAVSMNYYTSLADLGIQTMNRYFEQVLQSSVAQSTAVAPTNQPSPLIFHGMRNKQTSNAFLIANHRSVAIDVAFDVAEVVSEDGKSRFKPKVVFTPKQCKIAPNSEKVVQCTLTLLDKYKAGQQYRGSISVAGFPEMSMPFSVDVEESPAATKPKVVRKKSAAGKSAKKVAAKKTAKKPGKKK